MSRCTVYLDDETEQEIEQILDYGDSKSGFIKDAVREKLTRKQSSEHETLDEFEETEA